MRKLSIALLALAVVGLAIRPTPAVAHELQLETIGGTVIKDASTNTDTKVSFNGSDSATLTASADTAEILFNTDIERISIRADGGSGGVHVEFGDADATQSDYFIPSGSSRTIDDLGAMRIERVNLYADDGNSASMEVYFEGAG